jgi:hypothetical protein
VRRRWALGVLVAALVGGALTTAMPAFAEVNVGCPSLSGKQTSAIVSAHYTGNTTVSYYFDSLVDEGSSEGLPGLMNYCVYPASAPDAGSITVSAVGANGGAWVDPPPTPNFSFDRPIGNRSNVPLDGRLNYLMGAATWGSGAPSGQTILMHINDFFECERLYPDGDSTFDQSAGTCWVLPAPRSAAAPSVRKDAAGSFDRTFAWTISKGVDTNEIDTAGSATFNYSVTVDAATPAYVDGNWQVSGQIHVTNPNQHDAISGIDVSDAIDNGGSCLVEGDATHTLATLAAGSTADLAYSCTYGSAPSSLDGTNTATATWGDQDLPTDGHLAGGSATGTASFTLAEHDVNSCVTVDDTLGGSLGQVCAGDAPKTFTYPYTFSGDPAGTCTNHDNTATISETGQSASQTVKVCVGADLTVAKDASGSVKRAYTWTVGKNVDKTVLEPGGTATYAVTVSQTGYTDSGWKVVGTITVTNPNDWEDVTLTNVADVLDNGGTCTVAPPTNVVVPRSSSVSLGYTCTYASAPSSSSGTNTATASWDGGIAETPSGSASGSAGFAFAPATTMNKTITVTDSLGGALGTLTATDTQPYATKTFTYTLKFAPPGNGCTTVTNVATIVETGQTASKSVKACNTGALTMGYWRNKNGQGLITGANQSSLATFLKGYKPFQDLGSGTVATYVTAVIDAANAAGPSMNAMLKAQMLATALDVYFSDPALGGNKIGATVPIGGATIDLTSPQNVTLAFGGASSMTVSQMLAYAAAQSTSGGASWYGNVKATQALAKNAFDAINNQAAVGP